MKKYPYRICMVCGSKYGKHTGCASTVYMAKCQVCGKKTWVTEPREFGYPEFPKGMKLYV
jgi:hypothetical protein